MIDRSSTYATSFYALSPDQIECLWEERSRQFLSVQIVEAPGEQLAVVLIRLGSELYALPLEDISSIRPNQARTRVPDAPEWLMGVVYQDERILSVTDLRLYLGLPPAAQPGAGAFVTIRAQAGEAIFFVDDVLNAETLQVREHAEESWIQLPKGCSAIVERWANPDEQPYIAVIDIQALLADPRLLLL